METNMKRAENVDDYDNGERKKCKDKDESRNETTSQLLKNDENEEKLKTILHNLKATMQKIFEKDLINDFDKVYVQTHTLVKCCKGEHLYDLLNTVLNEYLESDVKTNLLCNSDNIVRALLTVWHDYTDILTKLSDVFAYLDSEYMKPIKGHSIRDLGFMSLSTRVLLLEPLKSMVSNSLIEMVSEERRGKEIDTRSVKQVCEILTTVGMCSNYVYENVFESLYLDNSTKFYSNISNTTVSEILDSCEDVFSYVEKVNDYAKQEMERVTEMLNSSTMPKILFVIRKELIWSNGIRMRMKNKFINSVTDIMDRRLHKKLLTLASKSANLFPGWFLNAVGSYFKTRTEDYLEKLCIGNNCMESIIHMMIMVNDVQKILPKIQNMEIIMSPDLSRLMTVCGKTGEFLGTYMNNLIVTYGQHSESYEEKCLLNATKLLEYVQDKDKFENHYRQLLSKRLLCNKSISIDIENRAIDLIKMKCGSLYTSKLEKILEDLSVSNIITQEFKNVSSAHFKDMKFEMQVITRNVWFLSTKERICNLPPVPSTIFNDLAVFFRSKDEAKHLTLLPRYGFAEISAVIKSSEGISNATLVSGERTSNLKQYILQVSTYQMCILSCFNHRQRLTFEEISKETKISEDDLRHALQPLAMGRKSHRILLEVPDTRADDKNHVFEINTSFYSDSKKVTIPAYISKTDLEINYREKQIERPEHRKQKMEAAIVRTMKVNKTMSSEELRKKVFEILSRHFQPEESVYNECVKGLIKHEYIEVDKNDKNNYVYIA